MIKRNSRPNRAAIWGTSLAYGIKTENDYGYIGRAVTFDTRDRQFDSRSAEVAFNMIY